MQKHGPTGFAAAWLRRRGVDWAADLLEQRLADEVTATSDRLLLAEAAQ
jgi:hypothetical protein